MANFFYPKPEGDTGVCGIYIQNFYLDLGPRVSSKCAMAMKEDHDVDLLSFEDDNEEEFVLQISAESIDVQEQTEDVNCQVVQQPVAMSHFEPKFEGMRKQSYFCVKVVNAVSPKCIYVNIIDSQFESFSNLNQDMQTEMNQHSKIEKFPTIGGAYAAKFHNTWYRVVVEKINSHIGKKRVFFIDTGLLFNVEECFFLPKRFFTIPAQALRCVLDGVSGVLYGMKETWPHQTLECVRGCKDKKAVIFVEDFFKGALVGSKKQQTMVVAMYCEFAEKSVNRLLNAIYTERPNHAKIRFNLAAMESTSSAQ